MNALSTFASASGKNWFLGFILAMLLPAASGFGQSAPTITQQPVSEFVLPGGSATFDVSVSGAGPDTYQWLFDGVLIGTIGTVAGNE